MNYSELLQLAKGWGNFVSDRINILRLRCDKLILLIDRFNGHWLGATDIVQKEENCWHIGH